MQKDIIRRFQAALPSVREWIDEYLHRHSHQTHAVHSLSLKRLAQCYPEQLLSRSKTATVERIEFPPVQSFGLPEFDDIQRMLFDGITFKDTYFLRQGCVSESLHFHELVHVVQWSRLGVDNFLLAYGVGLLAGYQGSPLEQMAYELQSEFERGICHPNLVRDIEARTDTIWKEVARLIAQFG